jgi:hypothetical protein
MINEMERIWKKAAVVSCFKVLPLHSPGGTEENHKTLRIACLQTDILTWDFLVRSANHLAVEQHISLHRSISNG